ncbi:MAG: MinD/ParA family protein [Actinomycetota bacterium]|nr:MinD/ParA family protein [Actinomycetota bacterium]
MSSRRDQGAGDWALAPLIDIRDVCGRGGEGLVPASLLDGDPSSPTPRTRREFHSSTTVCGEKIPDRLPVRVRRVWQGLLTSDRERQEAGLDARLCKRRAITRTNLVAVVSPKGGVGKTTATFLIGDLLASRPKLRVLAIDTNPDFGTLAKLAPDTHRSEHQLTDVIAHMDRIRSAPELDPFMSTTPAGLHLLGAPQRPEVMEEMTPALYGRLLSFLGRFYHVILVDLGTGLTEPLARFALERADQAVLVTTPDWIASSTVLDSLGYVLLRLGGHQVTMATNKVARTAPALTHRLETSLRRHRIARRVEIPEDERLGKMLDQGTYVCEQLDRPTRHAVKRLALAVAEQLV